jgi:hypothetical protein
MSALTWLALTTAPCSVVSPPLVMLTYWPAPTSALVQPVSLTAVAMSSPMKDKSMH